MSWGAPASPGPDHDAPATAHEREPDHGLVIKGAGGAFYGDLFTIPTYGGEGWVAVGQHRGPASGLGVLHVMRGQTEFGLGITGVHIGPQVEWRFGPARLGGEFRFGLLSISHDSERRIRESASLGVAAHASLDLATFGGAHALFAVAALRVDDYFEPVVLSGTVSLGYRWER